MKRIIDKETKKFVRDDSEFDEEVEIGLEVEPAQGFYHPKWNGTEWVEGLTEEEIQELKNNQPEPEPTAEEQIAELKQALDIILGVE